MNVNLHGSTDSDSINGLEGNDVMSGNSGTDIADSEKGDNSICFGGYNSLDQITGGPDKVVI